MRINTSHVLFMLLFACSCIDPYNPSIDDYLDLPVVEGIITNEPGPYIIKLSRSVALDNMDLKPIRGAAVIISDDAGTEETLTETIPGTYVTSASGIRGEAGRSYRLTLEIDGRTFRSDFETLLVPVEIDTLFTRIESKVEDMGSEGLQFYVSTDNISDAGINLLWKFTETYKFQSELTLDYIYYGPDSMVENYSDSGSICWMTEKLDETFTYKAANLTSARLTNFPLHYINNLTNKLSVKYSVLVYQYTISEKAYHFWNEIEKLHAESGSLYTRQPYQVKGNLMNPEKPEDIILGYFLTAGVSKKRLYVDRPSFTFDFNFCNPDINLFQTVNPWELKFPLYAMQLPGDDQAFARLSCFDCRMRGGTETRPEFWEE